MVFKDITQIMNNWWVKDAPALEIKPTELNFYSEMFADSNDIFIKTQTFIFHLKFNHATSPHFRVHRLVNMLYCYFHLPRIDTVQLHLYLVIQVVFSQNNY